MKKYLFIFLLFLSQLSYSQWVKPTFPYDVDAMGFFDLASTTAAQKTIINTFVLGLKTDSIWDLCEFIYPFVGGDSVSHSMNLKDPGLLADNYHIIFINNATHSASGVDFNGTTQCGQTFFYPYYATRAIKTSVNLTYYITENCVGTAGNCEFGGYTANYWALVVKRLTTNVCYSYIQNATDAASYTAASSAGLWMADRTAANRNDIYLNGTSVGNNTTTESGVASPNAMVYVGGMAPTLLSNRNICFAAITPGMLGWRATKWCNRINAMELSLGRNTY